MHVDTEGISCCFDERAHEMVDDYRRGGLSETSSVILDYLRGSGLQGATVLELGCGIGSLTDELVKSGAASARGVDLSPQMVEKAKALSVSLGVSGNTTYEVADGAVAQLPPSDLVILDAVFCCYPDAQALMRNSSAAAVKRYVVALPDDRRPLLKVLKHLLPLQSLISRRSSFRFYIHPVDALVRDLRLAGFRLVSDFEVGLVWTVLAFERSG